MRKSLLVLLMTGLTLIVLGGCSVNISNEQLEKDILSLASLDQISKVSNITIIDKTSDNDSLTYTLSTSLESINFTATANIKLVYVKTKGKWGVLNYNVDFINVSPKAKFNLDSKMEKAIHNVSTGFFEYVEGKSKSSLSLVSTTLSSSALFGTGTVVIEENYEDEFLTMDAQYTLKATYMTASGWTYELVDWIYHDSMKWTGTYDIHWTKEVPGFPEEGLNTFYKLGTDLISLQLSGECRITRQMGQSDNDIQENTLQISFAYEGIHLSGQPTFARMTNRLFFQDPINQDTLLVLVYNPFHVIVEGYDPTNYFYGSSPSLESVMTRRP